MNKIAASSLLFALAVGAGVSLGHAAPKSFDFKDPKGVNNVQFNLDAPLEAISGSSTGISGTILFDPAKPAATTGKIVIATPTLSVGNPMMKEHLHSPGWLDVAKFPEITFEAVKVANAKTNGDVTTADVTGKLTIKGITKEVTVPVTFTYLAGKMGARINKPELGGDLLVVRSRFSVNRSDFDIQAGKNLDKVAETIELNLSIAGASPAA
jgi:polyisoprenoid-binding protein YceI